MEKKIRIALSILILLCLFAPINDEWPIGILFYLVVGTLTALFVIIPDLVGMPDRFTLYMSPSPVNPTISISDIFRFSWWIIRDILYSLAILIWYFALPLLLIWNLYLIKPRTAKVRSIYRIWLLASLISSIFISYMTPIPKGNGLFVSYWFNPVLLMIAAGIEIWLWVKDQNAKNIMAVKV